MLKIEENVVLEERNVISYREKLSLSNSVEIFNVLNQFIEKNKLVPLQDFSISVTYSVSKVGKEDLIDSALFWKIDREVAGSQGVRFLPVFRVSNAIRCITNGSVVELREADVLMKKYIKEHNMTPCTPCCMVAKGNPADQKGMHVELYIGMQGNKETNIM